MPLIFKVGNQSKKNWRHPLLFLLFSTAIVLSLPSPSDDEEKSKNYPDVNPVRNFDNFTDILPPHTCKFKGRVRAIQKI